MPDNVGNALVDVRTAFVALMARANLVAPRQVDAMADEFAQLGEMIRQAQQLAREAENNSA